MIRVYVSSTEEDFVLSNRIKDWMRLQNYEPVTLNDQITSKKEGWTNWHKSLAQTLEYCHAVILVLTPEWTNSKWCFAEFTKSYSMGKTIFGVIEKPLNETFSEPDIQVFDLIRDRDQGLSELAVALRQALPQSGETFDFDPKRPVYPGLKAFDHKDHAIFFSRDDDIRRIIDRLNTRRRQGGARLLALLGASGTGMSSLLKAGIMPRIERDKINWISLPVIRPQMKPVEELAKAFAYVFGKPERWRDWHTLFWGNEFKEVTREIGQQLRDRLKQPSAQILLPIDQGEELFSISQTQEQRRFLDILGAIFDDDMPYLGIVALRPDFLAAFQAADQLSHTVEEFSPRLMSLSSIRKMITGPGRLANLNIEDGLVDIIIQDASREGALPLLGYTLRHMYDHSRNDTLTTQIYKNIGLKYNGATPLGNLIAKTAEQLLDAGRLNAKELEKINEFFTKTLLWRDADNRYVARPVPFSKLDADIKAFAKKFIDHGLLTLRDADGKSIIEYAHLSILQNWPRLDKWLEESFENTFVAEKKFDNEKKQSDEDDILELTLDNSVNIVEEITIDAEKFEHKPAQKNISPILNHPRSANENSAAPHTLPHQDTIENRIHTPQAPQTPTPSAVHKQTSRDAKDAFKIFARVSSSSQNNNEDWVVGIEDHAQLATLKMLGWVLLIIILATLIGLYWPAVKKFAGFENESPNKNSTTIAEVSKNIGAAEQTGAITLQSIKTESPETKSKQAPASPSLNDILTDNTSLQSQQQAITLHKEPSLAKSAKPPDGIPTAKTLANAKPADTTPEILLAKAEQKFEQKKLLPAMLLAYEALNMQTAKETERENARMFLTNTLSNLDNLLVFQGRNVRTVDIAFSQNSQKLAKVFEDDKIWIIDLISKRIVTEITNETSPLNSVIFSAKGKNLITVSANGDVKFWNTTNGTLARSFTTSKSGVTAVAYSKDGHKIAIANTDHIIRIWDTHKQKIKRTLKGYTNPVTSMSFHANGKRLAAGSQDGAVYIWNALNGKKQSVLKSHNAAVRDVAFAHQDEFLLTASDDETIKVWESTSGKEVSTFTGHADAIKAMSLSQHFVMTTSTNKEVLLWDRASGQVHDDFLAFNKTIKKAVFSPDGRWIGVISTDNKTHIIPSQLLTDRRIFEGHTDQIFSAQFDDGNKSIITASKDNTARIWNTSTGQQSKVLSGHVNQVYHGQLSPDRTILATASGDQTIRIWDVRTEKELKILAGHNAEVNRVAFHPQGQYLASASSDKTVFVWDLNSGKVQQKLLGHKDKVWSVMFSPGGTRIITASQDKTIRVWDTKTGKQIALLKGHKDAVVALDISPKKGVIASASMDRTVRFWDIETLRPLPQILLHDTSVLSVGFGGDGNQVITGSFDKIARIWDFHTSRKIYDFKGHNDRILSAVLSSNGVWALTASTDDARLWRLFPNANELSYYVMSIIPRCFNAQERIILGLSPNLPKWCQTLNNIQAASHNQ